MKKLIIAAYVLACTLGSAASAADFTTADQLFDGRQTGYTHYQAAVNEYTNIIRAGSLSTDELFYAVSQINRLHLLYGDLVLRSFAKDEYSTSVDLSAWKPSGNVDKARQDTFDTCVANTELLNVDNANLKSVYANDTGLYKAQYYYWHLACLALRAEASSIIDRIKYVKELEKSINPALSLTNKTYEGGGVLRPISGVYSNLLALPFGLYKPGVALDLLVSTNKILDFAAHPQDPYGRSGSFFFGNYRYIARAFAANNKNAEARTILATGLANIEDTLDILSDGDEDSWTPTTGNIFELSLERDRIAFEASKL